MCGRALEILEAARTLGEGAGPLVFTRPGGKPLNDKELRWLVREQGSSGATRVPLQLPGLGG